MKKLYSLVMAMFAVGVLSAQLVITQPAPGVLKLTYGAANDYSLYDPGFGTQTFYVHSWSSPGENSANTLFEDAWTNSNITMTYDSSVGAYVGTVDLNSKIFTNSNNTMPAGTTVNNISFVFKDLQNGNTKQSGDLSGSTYGFTPVTTTGTLGVVDASALKGGSAVVNGQLLTSRKGSLDISVYDFSGKLVKSMKTSANGTAIDLNIAQAGLYLVKIFDGASTEVVKFRK